MELKYGEALYFLDEVEYKEEYKEGDKIKVYLLIKRDNKPWLEKNELEYKEKEEGGSDGEGQEGTPNAPDEGTSGKRKRKR